VPLIRKPPPPVASSSAAAGADSSQIFAALARGNDDERWAAARAAAEIPGSVPALEDALLREQSRAVRAALFSSLARIASPQSVEAVLPLLRSDDASLRTEAFDALAAMKDVAWPYVSTLLRDPVVDVRILACGLMRDMPREIAGALCCEVLDAEEEPNVCAAVVDVLAEIGEPSALPALARCATRFDASPFLAFSVQLAIDRIRSQVSSPRA
jgi:HEAT repeat protein